MIGTGQPLDHKRSLAEPSLRGYQAQPSAEVQSIFKLADQA